MLGAMGVYGIGLYHQYVGRSHPWNWFHVSLPLVILLCVFGHLLQLDIQNRSAGWVRSASRETGLIVALVGIAVLTHSTLTKNELISTLPTASNERWTLPGTGFEATNVGRMDQREATLVVARIQQLVAPEERIAIISRLDAFLYVLSGRRPFSRFNPMSSIITYSQAAEAVSDLDSSDLHFVLIDRRPGADSAAFPGLAEGIGLRFEHRGDVGLFEIWQKIGDANPILDFQRTAKQVAAGQP